MLTDSKPNAHAVHANLRLAVSNKIMVIAPTESSDRRTRRMLVASQLEEGSTESKRGNDL